MLLEVSAIDKFSGPRLPLSSMTASDADTDSMKQKEPLKDFVLKCRLASKYMKQINHCNGCTSDCGVQSCRTIKVLLKHVASCPLSFCVVSGCSQTKKLLSHDAQCKYSCHQSGFCLMCSLTYQDEISITQMKRIATNAPPLTATNGFRRRKSVSMDDADPSASAPMVDTDGFAVPSLLPKRFRLSVPVSKPRFNSFHSSLPLNVNPPAQKPTV
jgi:hypothetical protein